MRKIVAMAGGTGGAKLLRGLAHRLEPRQLVVIGNTGDDFHIWGLSVCPDLDTVMYTLGNRVDEAKGWGRRDDTFQCLEAMRELGQGGYLSMGDRDLAVHLYRTSRLAQGASLTHVTRELCERLGIGPRLLPMSDRPVATQIRTPEGWLAFQEFFVRERCRPEILEIDYAGAEVAPPTREVLEALEEADAIIVCPSNPISSVGPILALPGMVDALANSRGIKVAVSPVIGDAPVSGPAGAMMRAHGLEVSVVGVARAYAPWLDAIVCDERDRPRDADLGHLGVRPVFAKTLMRNRAEEIALADAVLQACA